MAGVGWGCGRGLVRRGGGGAGVGFCGVARGSALNVVEGIDPVPGAAAGAAGEGAGLALASCVAGVGGATEGDAVVTAVVSVDGPTT